MKYFPVCLLLLLSVSLLSCRDRKSMIIGAWHVVKWENPARDSFFANAKNYIDTIGKGHDAATNIEIYGVANMDSMRDILQKQYDSAKNAEDQAASKTVFTFGRDGIVYLDLNGNIDTCKWLIDNDNGLILEEKGFENAQGISKYQIVTLTDKKLVLKFREENVNATVTFEH